MLASVLKKTIEKSPLPRRATLAVLWGAAAAAIGAALYASGRRRAFMPGPLTKAHRRFEFKCEVCHTPFRNRVQRFNDRCSAPECHAKVLDTKSDKSDNCISCHKPHPGRAFAASCTMGGCHKELLSPAAERESKPAAPKDKFNHKTHDVRTRHRTRCDTCHHATEDGAGFLRPTHEDCRSCHEHVRHCPPLKQARKRRGKRCAYCHDPQYNGPGEGPRPFAYVVFSHRSHAAFTCEECHADIDAARADPKRFAVPMSQCRECHADTRRTEGKAPTNCLACHRAHHRYGRFAEAQIERGLVRAGKDWVSFDEAQKRFGDYAGRALSALKREEPDEAKLHFELAKTLVEAVDKSRWAKHPSAAKMRARLKALAKDIAKAEAAAAAGPPAAQAARAEAQRPVKLRAATAPRKKAFEYVSAAHTYARRIEKALDRLDLDCQLVAIDGNAKTKYAGVTLRKEVFWSLYGLRQTAEIDALSVIKTIFDRLPDVQEVMVEVEAKLGDENQERYDRVLYVTATRQAHKKLDYAHLTLGKARAAFSFQYDKRVKAAKPEE